MINNSPMDKNKNTLSFLQNKLGKRSGIDRLEKIKVTRGKGVFLVFPPKNFISRDLKLLKYIAKIAGLNVENSDADLKLILHSKDNNDWYNDFEEIEFHSYITEFELKEWIFELLDFKEIKADA